MFNICVSVCQLCLFGFGVFLPPVGQKSLKQLCVNYIWQRENITLCFHQPLQPLSHILHHSECPRARVAELSRSNLFTVHSLYVQGAEEMPLNFFFLQLLASCYNMSNVNDSAYFLRDFVHLHSCFSVFWHLF